MKSISASEYTITMNWWSYICINPWEWERLIWKLNDYIPSIFTQKNYYEEDFNS